MGEWSFLYLQQQRGMRQLQEQQVYLEHRYKAQMREDHVLAKMFAFQQEKHRANMLAHLFCLEQFRVVEEKRGKVPKDDYVKTLARDVSADTERTNSRADRRHRVVCHVKSTSEYQLYMKVRPRNERSDTDPQTPDADDRLLSKRQWEKQLRTWIHGIRQQGSLQ